MAHSDHKGSGAGEKGETAPERRSHSAFAIRLTAEKCGISGSLDQSNEPELIQILKHRFPRGSVNYEKGKKGQYHFQITVFTKKGKRERRGPVREYLKNHFPDLEWPKKDYCEGALNAWASETYCRKTETAQCEPWIWGNEGERDLRVSDLPTPYAWQQKWIDRYTKDAPMFNPMVDWIYDVDGQIGKTMLVRFLVMLCGFYLLSGGKEKMRHLAANNPARGYCINITRSEQDTTSYPGLEQISDQVFADTFGSEMQGMTMRKGAHLAIFANFPPKRHEMSSTRWRVWRWNGEDFELE
jgi:hypothetical protein